MKVLLDNLCWRLFYNKVTGLQAVTLLKRDSDTGVSM